MTERHLRMAIACGVVVAAIAAADAQAPRSSDWPQWRGPNRDGVAASFTEPASWPAQLTRKWKIDVGIGYATPVLVGNRVYMFSRRGENEVLAALDAESGKEIWQSSYPASFTLNSAAVPHAKGPKSTPTVANGKVYTLGMTGILMASDAATGKQLWRTPAPPSTPLYHTGMSPLVDRNLLIVHMGGHDKGALTAFDPASGTVKWSWTGDGPSYGSPMAADFGGTRQVIVFTQDNLVGVAAATGQLLWKRSFTTPYTQNIITPILYGETVIMSGLEKPVTAFKIVNRGGTWTTENVWENPEVSLYMTNGVVARDALFAMSHRNSGQFFWLDAKSGKTLWKSPPRQATNAAIVRAGNTLFVLKDDAELIVASADPGGFSPLKRYTVADSATWAMPVVADNRIFVKDNTSLALWTW